MSIFLNFHKLGGARGVHNKITLGQDHKSTLKMRVEGQRFSDETF